MLSAGSDRTLPHPPDFMNFSNSIELTMTAESNAGKMRLGISGARMGWRALLAGVVFAAFAGSANAQDWYWTGAASANWSNPANWNSAADGTGTAPETVQDLFTKPKFQRLLAGKYDITYY